MAMKGIKKRIRAYQMLWALKTRGMKRGKKFLYGFYFHWAVVMAHFKKNPRLIWIFLVTTVLLSSEVWVPYLLGVVFWANEELRLWWFGIGSVCWAFWLGPGTPFIALDIALSLGIDALFLAIKKRLRRKKEGKQL